MFETEEQAIGALREDPMWAKAKRMFIVRYRGGGFTYVWDKCFVMHGETIVREMENGVSGWKEAQHA